jgi:hypothetical protein
LDRPDQRACVCLLLGERQVRISARRDTEVDDLGVAVTVNQNVARLEIAMDKATPLL